MLTHIEIEGFKSFGSPATKVEVTPLTFFVGPNASGKSNFLAALEFLQLAVKYDVETAVDSFDGSLEIRSKISNQKVKSKSLRIGVKDTTPEDLEAYEVPGYQMESYDYKIALGFGSDDNYPSIESEVFTAKIRDPNGRTSEYGLYRHGRKVRIHDVLPGRDYDILEMFIPEQDSARLTVNATYNLPPVIMKSRMSNWRFFNINADSARQAFRATPGVELGRSGQRLGVALKRLEQRRDGEVFAAVQRALRAMVPGFKHIRPVPVGDKWAFQVEEDEIIGGLIPSSVSDGTVRLLTLLTITLDVTPGDLIAIEEPENGLHPHIIPEIAEHLRYCADEGAQVFVTTHNPDFLDEASPNEVFLCDRVNGSTQLVRASSVPDIEPFRRSFSLGELWEQGALGGTP